MTSFAFDHVHLRSRDPAAAARFYVDRFGASVIERLGRPDPLRIVVDLHGCTLFIEQCADGASAAGRPPLGLDHLALAVTGFDATVAALRSSGVVFAVEPHEPRPGIKIAFVTGPDDVRIELLERSAP